MNTPRDDWYTQPKGEVHESVFRFVRKIEDEQGDAYDRLASLESLYDPYSPTGDDTDPSQRLANVSENLIASNIDTVFASIAHADIRARYQTDGADWSTQRRAKKMEYYGEGLGKQLGLTAKCKTAFREAPKKGMGLTKVYADRWDRPVIEVVAIEDVVVPDCDSRVGALPLQLHHVQRNYDRDKLRAEYPDHEEEIDQAYSMRSMTGSSLSTSNNKLTVIESIRLPIGRRRNDGPAKAKRAAKPPAGKARYVAGRRTITIEGATLLDEEYHDEFYPFAMVVWSERNGSFYPISGAERIMGIQRALNKRNWQIERVLDQNALLTTYVRPADGNLAVKSTKIGNVAVVKGDYPHTPNPPLVAAETYQSRHDLKESAPEQMGVSRFSSQSTIPPGLETGAAVREYKAQSTIRHSPQESAYEQFVLDTNWLLIHVCKKLGREAPTVLESRWRKPIAWADVDMGSVKIQISAASTLPRTSAGREQTVLEWAQAGVISTDSARRLIGHPDLERELSMYTAALESIEEQIEVILDGGISTPEPFDNLEMVVWRGNATYHIVRPAGAPEEVLENLRDFIAQAAFIIDQKNAALEQPMTPPAPAPGGPPGGPPAPMMPPMMGRPSSAFAPEAMQLLAD